MKKILIASLMMLSLTGTMFTTHAATEDQPSLMFLRDNGIVSGDADTGNLRLEDPINRAEFMKIITSVVMGERPDETFANCLADIHTEWFAPDVCWAESRGYIDGYDDGTFKAGNNVTHAEALKIIHEAFHIDYERYMPVVNQDLWYDKYLKSALGVKIADESVENKLAEKATRGEVFEYLYRAMVITDRDSFVYQPALDEAYKEWYPRYKNETRALTTGEEELLKVMETTFERGLAPTVSSGSAMFDLLLTNNNYPGEKVTARFDLGMNMQHTGTGAVLDGGEASVDLGFDVFTNANGDLMKVEGKIGVDMAATDKVLYLKLRELEVVDIDLPIIQQVALQQMVDKLKEHKETWYSVDMDGLGIAEPFTEINTGEIAAMVRSLLEQTTAPLLSIDIDNKEELHTMLITINEDQVVEYMKKIMYKVDKSTNLYEVQHDMRRIMPKLSTVLDSLSYVVGYFPSDHLLRSEHFIMEPTTIENVDDLNWKVESFTKGTSDYPESVEITMPEDAQEIGVLLDDLGLGAQSL